MSVKEKILDALDVAIDDVSELRLVDILLDAYKLKVKRIEELNAENAMERERLYAERDMMAQERHKMRSDPLYCAAAEYYFSCDGRKFGIHIQGPRIDMFERRNNVDIRAQQLSRSEW